MGNRILRAASTIGGVTLVSDAEIVDTWKDDNAFAGFLAEAGLLTLHADDLSCAVDIDGTAYWRTYNQNAVPALAPILGEVEATVETVEYAVEEAPAPKKKAKK